METVLLSAGRYNIEPCVELAIAHHLGIEVMAFAFPEVLDGDWKALMGQYRHLLAAISAPITLHGPFMDMAPGSADPLINTICRTRYQHAIEIAAQFNAEKIVFHANFIAAIHERSYREGWHRRNVDFWGDLAHFAQKYGVMLAVENMWEFDPTIITNVLAEVNHPYCRACLDVGHAYLYGSDYPFEVWLDAFAPYVVHMHMNNTHGRLDTHNSLADGLIRYEEVLPMLRETLVPMPTVTLEMYDIQNMRQSLPFFELDKAATATFPTITPEG
ncbi:MAG: sugar phosphate isomerase/epimerase family protein [Phototrophicaceae bacterium]|jgi:sugar phosphate isomerase/epimerase